MVGRFKEKSLANYLRYNIRFHHNEYYWSRAKDAGNAGALRSLAALIDEAFPF